MKRWLAAWRLERFLPWLGSAGSVFGGFAVMCCIGWTGLTIAPVRKFGDFGVPNGV